MIAEVGGDYEAIMRNDPNGGTLSETQMRHLYDLTMKKFRVEVTQTLSPETVASMSSNQLQAVLSMVYHGGIKMLGPFITAALKREDWVTAEHEIRENSNKSGDERVKRRRTEEANLFHGPKT